MQEFENLPIGKNNEKDVSELIEQVIGNDSYGSASYFARLFRELLKYEKFVDFVRDNFVVEHHIDRTTGSFLLLVTEVKNGEKVEEVRSKRKERAEKIYERKRKEQGRKEVEKKGE